MTNSHWAKNKKAAQCRLKKSISSVRNFLFVLLNVDLRFPVEHPDEALGTKLVDQFADGDARAADDGADFVLRVIDLEVVPSAVDDAAGVGCGAIQPLEAILAGGEDEVGDLLPQDAHFLGIAQQDGLPKKRAFIQQHFVFVVGNAIENGRDFRLGEQPGHVVQRAGRFAVKPARGKGVENLFRSVLRNHVVAGTAAGDIVYAFGLAARLQKDGLGGNFQHDRIFGNQILKLVGIGHG